ncbi:pyruvate ferredoxin oxidoreductase [Clostridium botulinum C]|uniref:Pyruvate ferredoxin oxidoreductase n=2 Tax=Clostridium botulinum TaxID=1491 RepID=A0A9Q4TRK3_CLOBO|nr:transketolase C-terminal domain-containing protein [Clostridium botulinum]MCD3195335.1 pyruvate ferredoxin oxidoreductase [Clostridium botulinum C]MCD3200673.1 pyruvate ferredoxin oxidoreductase [Clostridium botulinum C]MCD3206081.1 pyruvate ferredoxin oxidoreductase [Clostridium botulinum C]MCD3208677.1 pyruvate ferredoxin oxidoreductase [Clostridium botulinum C]MCD3225625.1 pyruvate ferredoxin oxidoreductase [Clostridium botulinum C]
MAKAKQIRKSLSGNEAVATAMMQINPEVVAAFPITPSTEVVQYFSSFIANGKCTTEFVTVESEHSAISACIGASAAGARVMTATSSQGLALMWEMLHIAAGDRCPIVMATVNRAISVPLNIHNDHSDSMGARDTGFIQLYAENTQEAYDNFIQAVRIAEHEEVMTPAMVCYDGFITSHAVENVFLMEKEAVRNFVGKNKRTNKGLLGEKKLVGSMVLPNFYMEMKHQQLQGLLKAKDVLLDVAKEYEVLTGRKYGLFEEYRLDDAEVAMVIIGSSAGTAKKVVDDLREKGIKAGVLKIRLYRPFPAEEIAEALKNVKAIAVMDKAEALSGNGGPVFNDIASALYGCAEGKILMSYIYGLGGRDVTVQWLEKVFKDLTEAVTTRSYKKYNYLAVRA